MNISQDIVDINMSNSYENVDSTINKNHESDGTTINTNRESIDSTINKNHESIDSTINKNHESDGTTINTNHESDGTTINKNHESDGLSVNPNQPRVAATPADVSHSPASSLDVSSSPVVGVVSRLEVTPPDVSHSPASLLDVSSPVVGATGVGRLEVSHSYASLDVSSPVVGGAAGVSRVEAMPAPRCQALSRSRRISPLDPSGMIPARRSSTRSIKRKKFDDELVESSLVKTERGRVKAAAAAAASISSGISNSSISHHGQIHSQIPAAAYTSLAAGGGGGASLELAVTESGKSASLYLSSTPATSSVAAAAVLDPASSPLVGGRAIKEELREPVRAGDIALPSCPSPEKRGKLNSGKVAAHSQKTGVGKVLPPRAVVAAAAAAGSSIGKNMASKSGLAKSSGHSKSRSRSRRARRQKTAAPAVKDLGRWKPQDDLALITAVQQTNDLSTVHAGVKFSSRFTLKEIEERWYALLYDTSVSKIAMEAARQLHSETVATIQGKALYSCAEEKLLGTFASTSQPSLENFQNMMSQFPEVFHPARTAKTLHSHWLLMKQYHLLPDQTVQPMPRGDHILNLSDIEDFMNDDDNIEGTDETVEKELALVDRRNKREIRHLEQEMPKWQVLVDSVTGISMPDFDSQTLAVLRGRLVRYLMRSREISLGRSTKDNHVDVDLSLEGPSWKISRRQGIIKLRNSGDFFIANEGKLPILVDGRPVMAGSKQKLCNNSVVEISCLRFTFLINMEVINTIRADVSKTINISGTS